jgi:hypothetical protein
MLAAINTQTITNELKTMNMEDTRITKGFAQRMYLPNMLAAFCFKMNAIMYNDIYK